ncbi:MAG: 4-phosphoerythronate dehydrogenase PdxB [Bacteroidales bacterium]|nr:4-phosphoerythronate dehydrogenase PdxB [Bacteroidales bacterium]
MRIVADDKIPFLKGALERVARVDYLPGDAISNKDLSDADGLIIRTRTQCDRNLLEGTKVRFIATATIGYDHIDRDYCEASGIRWTNAPGCNSTSVQQYLVSTLLFLANLKNLDLGELKLGVVGVGNVGSKVSMAAEALGMEVLLNDPPRMRREGGHAFVELDEMLELADILTLHVPLNRGGVDNTIHMVDERFIQRVKRDAILINTSRGAVVDEIALFEGIRTGTLSDVVMDVFENEPNINLELLKATTVGTPHIAGYSLDGKANGTTMSVRAISRYFDLGLDEWSPLDIPMPPEHLLYGDVSGSSKNELLWDLVRQTYDVTSDDRRLRSNPEAFERLRGDYPLRREPAAYSVRLFQGYTEVTVLLEKLGFSVLTDYCA